MKITIKDGKVTASPETEEEVKTLLDMGGAKNSYRKPCPVCGKLVKGKKGAAVHSRIHAKNA